MTKLAKWHVEEILENFVLGGFPVKDDDRFLACSSILTSMIDTVEVDEPNKAFIFHTMSGSEYLCPFEDIRWTDRFAEFSKDNLERLNISRAFVDEAIKLAHVVYKHGVTVTLVTEENHPEGLISPDAFNGKSLLSDFMEGVDLLD